MSSPLTLRKLLEQLSGEVAGIVVTVEPGSMAETVLDHEIWLVNYDPTPEPAAIIHEGVIYLTNRKDTE